MDIKIKSYIVCVIEFSSLIEEFPDCETILNLIRDSLSIKSLSSIKIFIEKINGFIDVYSYYPNYKDFLTKLENIKHVLSTDCYKDCLLDLNK